MCTFVGTLLVFNLKKLILWLNKRWKNGSKCMYVVCVTVDFHFMALTSSSFEKMLYIGCPVTITIGD